MKGQWLIWLLVTGLVYVSGKICDTKDAEKCYHDLVNYEGVNFPFYGKDEAKLDGICGNINESFVCIKTYFDTCNKNPECDDPCHELLYYIDFFERNTGLKDFAEELCDEYSVFRHIYLENYECLESNLKSYSACHNKSDLSQAYIETLKGEENKISSACCYFSWYHDCFINITRDHCSKNATVYVNFGLMKLVGQMSDKVCNSSANACSSPPLPPPKSSASIISCPVAGTVILFYFILFMNLLMY